MISEEYRELNAQLHTTNDNYGKNSSRWAPVVMALCAENDSQDVLDYGCGKAELNLHMPFNIQCYDPAIPKYDDLPLPADIVVCTDVLEHVEPEHLSAVLGHLWDMTGKVALLNVATRFAVKTLADGRNAHLIVEPLSWWLPKIEKYWVIKEMQSTEEEFTCTATPRPESEVMKGE